MNEKVLKMIQDECVEDGKLDINKAQRKCQQLIMEAGYFMTMFRELIKKEEE